METLGWKGQRSETLTTRVSLPSPMSLMGSAQPLATAPNRPGFEEAATHDTSLKHKRDEQRWSELMASAQAGNEPDYRQLLTELTEVIHSFLCSRFGHHNLTEDCVQETLIAIHMARHTYDQSRQFRPWLFAIVRHKAIDTLRKHRAQQKVTTQYEQDQDILSQASYQNEAESEIMKGSLLASLPVEHREVLVLTKIIGLSVVEVAEKLAISESLVKVRVHRAIGKLRKMMETDQL
jgi:RNA polymerase sigma-70 factor (ECF subfamily)